MRRMAVGFFISLAFFIALLATLSDYGVHEDNLFHFMRGQYFLQKLTGKTEFDPALSGQSPVFYVPGQRISLYKANPPEEFYAPLHKFGKQVKEIKAQNAQFSFYKQNAWGKSVWEDSPNQGHPPVSDILMAITNRIFYEKLGIVGDIEGYYIYIAFVSALAVFFVYIFAINVFGQTAAIFAALTLALFPFYFSESHFNTKDTVQMSFFTGALISLYFFVTTVNPKRHSGDSERSVEDSRIGFWTSQNDSFMWFASYIIFAFLALGTKWNIAFLPFIFLPWLWFVRKKSEVRDVLRLPKIFVYGILGIVIPFLLLIIFWPYLWTDPLAKLVDTFNFYRQLAVLDPRIDALPPFTLPLGINPTPLLRVITMTPPLTLVLFMIGIFALITRKITTPWREKWLILLWLGIPLVRVSWQLADMAGSIRQFIEYLPAFAIVAGVGGSYIVAMAKKKYNNITIIIFIIVITVILALPIVRYHPNQNLYFNFLAGGFSGAFKSGLYSWKASYDNVYRQGAVWMNDHAQKNAKLAYLDGTMLAISPLWLRDDIYFGSYFSGFEQKGEYVISLVYPNPPSIFAYLYLDRFLDPVYEVKVDGVAVLRIWQNSKKYVRKEFREQKVLEGTFTIAKVNEEKGRVWEIHLGQSRKMTRLILTVPKECSGRTGGVWSFIYNGKQHFIVPQQLRSGVEVEIDFPGEPVEAIRFWDIERNSCLYDAKLDAIYALM